VGARAIAVALAAVAVVAAALVPDIRSSNRAPVALGAPHFIEETASAGIDHIYGGGFEYAVGGGVAAFDCNGDGRTEIYLEGGSGSAAL
jgi:hypothetical protein